MSTTRVPSPEELLGHAAWAHRLASHLVGEPTAADDLVQDAWEVAVTKGYPVGIPLGAWLTGVMRNLARFRARGEARRARRDADFATDETASGADEVLTRFETQRQLAELVLGLREPYRSALLLRYYDGLSAVEIARKLGIPAATVRWRVKQGLDELRALLTERHGGAWLALMAPLAERTQRAPGPWGWPASGLVALTALVALIGAWMLARGLVPSSRHSSLRPEPAATADPAAITTSHRAGSVRGRHREQPPVPAPVPSTARGTDDLKRTFVPLGAGPVRGSAAAKVTIIEFVDYHCPITARQEGTIERVLWVYGDEVRVQIVHRPLPGNAHASFAARAALAAAAQDKFWAMHFWLLAQQKTFVAGEMERHADALELDLDRFNDDMRSDAVTQHLVIDWSTADSLRVDVTPSFFINGRLLVGAQPFAAFKAIIDEEIARADALLARGVPIEQLYNEILRDASSNSQERQ